MKPGEFVDANGNKCRCIGIWVRGPINEGIATSIDPDFPLAVAALQSLLPKPTIHPAVGLRYCGEEEFEWDGPGELCRWHGGCVEWRSGIDRKWRASGLEVTDAFNAGRRYEKEHGDE